MTNVLKWYREYVALKAHFNQSNYDYFTYRHKTRATEETLRRRNDYNYFVWLSKYEKPFELLLSNIAYNSGVWIGDITSPEGVRICEEWMRRVQTLSYTFKQEIKALDTDFNNNILVPKRGHPELFRLLLTGRISLETFMIVVDLSQCFKYWKKNLPADDIIWSELAKRIVKYRFFLAPYYVENKTNYRQVLKDHFQKN